MGKPQLSQGKDIPVRNDKEEGKAGGTKVYASATGVALVAAISFYFLSGVRTRTSVCSCA